MRILILSPNQIGRYNWGHQLFRDEIGKHADVTYYGQGYSIFDGEVDASKIIDKHGPFDVVLTYCLRYSMPFENLSRVNLPKGHIIVDMFPPYKKYKGGMYDKYKPFLERNRYDFFFYRQRSQEDYIKKLGFNQPSFWLPFSVDVDKYRNLKFPKIVDVMTSSTTRETVYPNRTKVNNLVRRMRLSVTIKKLVHERYIKAINQAKICIISTNIFNSPNMKFTEFPSCGSFVLADKPADFDELGFKNNYHLVLYKGLKDLENKIRYYLKNEKEREVIAKNGMNFVRKNHNNTVRTKFLLDTIERMI